ncbi:MAG: hypothetical protein G8237_07305 [Magnetococcales bacterium]|nr:hypothetical protein [Magnetococcales bacterium]
MNTNPLILGWHFDGHGGGEAVEWSRVSPHGVNGLAPYWLHLNRTAPGALDWIRQRSGLEAGAIQVLLAEETRPRYVRFGNGAVLLLRIVNENAGHDFHDMVALRVWVDGTGVISVRGRRIHFIDGVRRALESRGGPHSPAELLVTLLEHLTARMEPILEKMRLQLDEMEHYTLTAHEPSETRRNGPRIRQQLGDLRVAAVALRRYLAPQREAIIKLMGEESPWVGAEFNPRLQEVVNETTRHMEDLDEIRDTAGIIQDSVANAINEGLNNLVFKLTMMSVFFMPLSFIVGWFGSNVSGLYLNADSHWFPTEHGFTMEGLLLLGVGLCELWLFRRFGWL